MKEENLRQRLYMMDLNDVQAKADKEFQKMRRLEESNNDGIARCISCGAFHHYKMGDGGHFIPRQHKGTRYERMNVYFQCKHCNKWLHGNHAKYRDGLIKKIGRDGVEELERIKDILPYHPSVTWREWCIETYFQAKKKVQEELLRIENGAR